MFLWGKRGKKGKNARQRYDVKYPVLPVRVPASLKEQLASEAASKDVMLSEYVRRLLQGFEVRERTVEKVVERIVEVPVVETVDNPEKDRKIRELERRFNRLKGIIPQYEEDNAELSKNLAHSVDEVNRLEDTLRSISRKHERLTKDHDARRDEVEDLRNRLSELSDENDKIRERMDWAIEELRSNDARNEKIARIIANDHGIEIRWVSATWREMP